MWLSDEEIRILTRRKQGAAQIRKLRELGVPHYVVDGKPVVSRSDVEHHRQSDKVKLRLAS